MIINIGPSIYIPTDKNIFDALLHKKVTFNELQKFLIERGILISEQLTKEELARTVAKLTFDYHDYSQLKKLLENPNRKEKSTSTVLKTKSNQEELSQLCQKIVSENKDTHETYQVIKRDNITMLITTYTDVDFTKTELRQRTTKTCTVELEEVGDEVIVRQPATKKGDELVSKIKGTLEKEKGVELEFEKLSLETITTPEARSYFFDRLINLVEGFNLEDVTSIDVYHHIDNKLDDDETDELSENMAGFIRKAVLSGGGVLTSSEFNQLHEKGFFISKIIWKAVDPLPSGDMVELEALFGNATSCTDYKYLVRGIYNFKESTGMHNVTKRPASKIEVSDLTKRLEKASKDAYKMVMKKYSEA